MIPSVILTQYDLDHMIRQWEPPTAPHCSNCLHAKVNGTPIDPEAYCERGHGREITLGRLIRAKNARGFRAAPSCPDFSSMSEEN